MSKLANANLLNHILFSAVLYHTDINFHAEKVVSFHSSVALSQNNTIPEYEESSPFKAEALSGKVRCTHCHETRLKSDGLAMSTES